MTHLKRPAMPRTWPLPRKGPKYVIKPLGRKLELCLPLGIALRLLNIAQTKKEIKALLQANEVRVDSSTRKDEKLAVGLFDTISIPRLEKSWQLILKGKKLGFQEVAEPKTKICKVIGKTTLERGKQQINLYDGRNILSNKPIRVHDSVVVDLTTNKLLEHLPLKEGAVVTIIGGKNIGKKGVISKTEPLTVKINNRAVEVQKKNLFVVK